MSDKHDDATTGEAGDSAAAASDSAAEAGDSAAADGAAQARPTGKRPAGKRSAGRGGGTALVEPAESSDSVGTAAKGSSPSRNPFAAVWLFLRQVVTELRKVIWPTRSQMINYTIIVLIFVVVLTTFISLLDLGFARLMLWAFG